MGDIYVSVMNESQNTNDVRTVEQQAKDRVREAFEQDDNLELLDFELDGVWEDRVHIDCAVRADDGLDLGYEVNDDKELSIGNLGGGGTFYSTTLRIRN